MKHEESGNCCVFSPDRLYRYSLLHSWKAFWEEDHLAVWIALNPSTADENQLDPTLRRIRGFSAQWGYNGFVMLNLFAFRATDPQEMKRAADPVGPENDQTLLNWTKHADRVFCAWGTHGEFQNRQSTVLDLLKNRPLHALRLTSGGFPSHPLYLPQSLSPFPWPN